MQGDDDCQPPNGSHYAVLGVSHTAADQEIRSAFRRLAAKWHPDKCVRKSPEEQVWARETFEAIQRAYNVLGSPEHRATYDAGLFL